MFSLSETKIILACKTVFMVKYHYLSILFDMLKLETEIIFVTFVLLISQ